MWVIFRKRFWACISPFWDLNHWCYSIHVLPVFTNIKYQCAIKRHFSCYLVSDVFQFPHFQFPHIKWPCFIRFNLNSVVKYFFKSFNISIDSHRVHLNMVMPYAFTVQTFNYKLIISFIIPLYKILANIFHDLILDVANIFRELILDVGSLG